MDTFTLIVIVQFCSFIAATVLGIMKKRGFEGFIAGLLLGLLGLIWILFQKPKEKCPDCGGVIVRGVRRCRHCGVELVKA